VTDKTEEAKRAMREITNETLTYHCKTRAAKAFASVYSPHQLALILLDLATIANEYRARILEMHAELCEERVDDDWMTMNEALRKSRTLLHYAKRIREGVL
jgi:hypothetical protein